MHSGVCGGGVSQLHDPFLLRSSISLETSVGKSSPGNNTREKEREKERGSLLSDSAAKEGGHTKTAPRSILIYARPPERISKHSPQ